MSKFIERLQQVSQRQPAPMGFQARRQETSRPRVQLVAHLEQPPAGAAAELSVLDAVIAGPDGQFPQQVVRGSWLARGTADEIVKAAESGADFVVLPSSAVVTPPDKKTGRVLVLDVTTGDALLRSVNELPVDAVLVTGEGKSLAALLSGETAPVSWNKLLAYQRFASLVTKPVLVSVPGSVSADEVQLIWETGVSGIIVHVGSQHDVKALPLLREQINQLPYPAPRKREQHFASLPQVREAEMHETEEEEEDDNGEG